MMNNTTTIEELKKSAIAYQRWIDKGFTVDDETDESDIYPSDFFFANATPKVFLELIDKIEELLSINLAQHNEFNSIMNSNHELRQELDSLKLRIDGGVRMYAIGKNAGVPADGYGHIANSTLILDDGVEL